MAREQLLSSGSEFRVDSGPEHHDSAVRGARAWVLRALLLVTSGALLATSPPERFEYSFEGGTDGPLVTLTSEKPAASFEVTVRVTALGPNGVDTTQQARSLLQGVISSGGASGRFVSVRAADGAHPEMHGELEVATGFTLARGLTFDGNCADPAQGEPCQATLLVDFERTDGGEGGGEVTVEWSIDLESSVEKPKSPSVGPLEAPWSVEIAPR
jgi:hypothetical protein